MNVVFWNCDSISAIVMDFTKKFTRLDAHRGSSQSIECDCSLIHVFDFAFNSCRNINQQRKVSKSKWTTDIVKKLETLLELELYQ